MKIKKKLIHMNSSLVTAQGRGLKEGGGGCGGDKW